MESLGGNVRLTRRRLLALALASMPVLAASCAPAPPPPAAPPAGQAQPAPAAPPAAKAAAPAVPPAKSGGTVNFAVTADPKLNPILAGDNASVPINKLLFNGLTRPDRDTLEPKPDLAVSWEPSNSGATWTFQLREGVKWHDGQPLTAEDVKFTFDAVLDPKVNTVMRANLSVVKQVDVVDPKTVRFTLAQPFAAFPTFTGHMGTSCLGIIPKHILANEDINTSDFTKTRPVGTGPFKFKEFHSADHVTLVANDAYHFGRPKLDTFNWKILPDMNAQLAQVKTGELTMAMLSPAQLEQLKGTPNLKADAGARVNFQYIGLNKSRPLFQDPRVRQAMMYALDREAIIAKIYYGAFTLCTGPIPPVLASYYEPDVTKYSFDLDKAKSLMAEAGWTPGPDGVLTKGGERFSFKLTSSTSTAGGAQVTAELQQRWKALGMETEIEMLQFAVFISQRRDSHNYDTMFHSWAVPPDPDQFAYWHSSAISGGLNAGEYRNPQADKLLEDGRATIDPAKRKAIYSQFQKLLADDLPEIFLWNATETRGSSASLQGVGDKSYVDIELHYVTDWSLA